MITKRGEKHAWTLILIWDASQSHTVYRCHFLNKFSIWWSTLLQYVFRHIFHFFIFNYSFSLEILSYLSLSVSEDRNEGMKERMNRKGMNDRKIGLFLQFGKFTIFSPFVFLFFLSLITVSPNLKMFGPGKTYNKYSCPVSHCCILKAGSRLSSVFGSG